MVQPAQAQRPVAQKADQSRAVSSRTWQEHRVRPGETLASIAQRYRVQVSHLVEWNKIQNPDAINVGDTLRVFAPKPQGRPSEKRQTQPRPENPAVRNQQRGSSNASRPIRERPEPRDRNEARRQHFGSDASALSKPQGRNAGSASRASQPNRTVRNEALRGGGNFSRARLHTLPSRRFGQGDSHLVFAMASDWGPLPEAEEPKSWWQRRKERRKARRQRRFEAKRQRALAEQRASSAGRSTYVAQAPAPPSRQRSRIRYSKPNLSQITANPAPKGKAQSVGSPNNGRLKRGIQMQSSNWYTVRTPKESWGSSHTINQLHHALVRFRINSNYKRELVVQDLSLKSGGRFPPHRSHQSGRDVDIRLCVNNRVAKNGVPRKIKQVDWDATWALVHELIKTGEIEYIFLTYERQKHLYRAAQRAGVPKTLLARWIQYPTHSKSQRSGIVRHSKGHVVHIHVRFRCGPNEKHCR